MYDEGRLGTLIVNRTLGMVPTIPSATKTRRFLVKLLWGSTSLIPTADFLTLLNVLPLGARVVARVTVHGISASYFDGGIRCSKYLAVVMGLPCVYFQIATGLDSTSVSNIDFGLIFLTLLWVKAVLSIIFVARIGTTKNSIFVKSCLICRL